MEPTPLNFMCKLIKPPISNIELLPGEIFVAAIYKNGSYINYSVSNYSRVYSYYRHELLTEFVTDKGYHRVGVQSKYAHSTNIGTYYLCLMSFQPIKEIDIFIPNHKDGNTHNNHLSNLEWVTVSGNTRHALDTGLANYKGENNARSIFTNEQVHYICSLLAQGVEPTEIATLIGYGEYGKIRNTVVATIRLIRRGQTYLDISTQYNIPGINGRKYYPQEFTKDICDYISQNHVNAVELCDHFGIPLEDRKMFLNHVQDITRRACDTFISNNYPTLYSPYPVNRSDPNYKWYY